MYVAIIFNNSGIIIIFINVVITEQCIRAGREEGNVSIGRLKHNMANTKCSQFVMN